MSAGRFFISAVSVSFASLVLTAPVQAHGVLRPAFQTAPEAYRPPVAASRAAQGGLVAYEEAGLRRGFTRVDIEGIRRLVRMP